MRRSLSEITSQEKNYIKIGKEKKRIFRVFDGSIPNNAIFISMIFMPGKKNYQPS